MPRKILDAYDMGNGSPTVPPKFGFGISCFCPKHMKAKVRSLFHVVKTWGLGMSFSLNDKNWKKKL